MVRTGCPRNASFAPSSISTMAGWWRFMSSARRRMPPAVVSPDTLALATCHGRPDWARRRASRLTHPCSEARP